MKFIKNKKSYIIIASFFGISLLIIILGIIYAFINPTAEKEETKTLPTPSISLTETQAEETVEPPIQYNERGEEKLLEIVSTRPPLSEEDKLAKAKILTFLPQGEKSGILYERPNFYIEYVNSADSFMVEILTTDLSQAKNEANAWFLSQGMSQQGVCNAPTVFYVNFIIAEEFRGTNTTFSTLAPGC